MYFDNKILTASFIVYLKVNHLFLKGADIASLKIQMQILPRFDDIWFSYSYVSPVN